MTAGGKWTRRNLTPRGLCRQNECGGSGPIYRTSENVTERPPNIFMYEWDLVYAAYEEFSGHLRPAD